MSYSVNEKIEQAVNELTWFKFFSFYPYMTRWRIWDEDFTLVYAQPPRTHIFSIIPVIDFIFKESA